MCSRRSESFCRTFYNRIPCWDPPTHSDSGQRDNHITSQWIEALYIWLFGGITDLYSQPRIFQKGQRAREDLQPEVLIIGCLGYPTKEWWEGTTYWLIRSFSFKNIVKEECLLNIIGQPTFTIQNHANFVIPRHPQVLQKIFQSSHLEKYFSKMSSGTSPC